MKWNRKTSEFQFAPYVSDDGRFTIGDINDCDMIPEYTNLKKHNWDSAETHTAFLDYCREHKIRINSANWVLKDGDVVVGIFTTVKKAKEVAGEL